MMKLDETWNQRQGVVSCCVSTTADCPGWKDVAGPWMSMLSQPKAACVLRGAPEKRLKDKSYPPSIRYCVY